MNFVILAVIAAVISVSSFLAGDKWRSGIVAARDLKAVQDNARVQILRADKADQAADRHEQTKTKIETRFVEVEKEVVRVVNSVEYRDRACLDDAGLRVLTAAIAGDNPSGKPATAVSSPVAP